MTSPEAQSVSPNNEIDATIAQLMAARAIVTSLQRELARLHTIDEAHVAYQLQLKIESDELEVAQRKYREAVAKIQRKRVQITHSETSAPPSANKHVAPLPAPTPRPMPEVIPRPRSTERITLKKLVNRWQNRLSLDQALIAQINSIADDAQRPLGEAIALFDEHVFSTALPGENATRHLARIREWHLALHAYTDHVRQDIGAIKTRYRTVIAIWKLWLKSKEGESGQTEWKLFVERSRAQKRAEIATLVQRTISLTATRSDD